MSVLAWRVPSSVQPAGGVVIVAVALFLVTNSSMPSVSRTAAGMVTRAVVWFHAACAEARKAMVSAAWAGDAVSPVRTASSAATMAPTAAAATLRRPARPNVCEPIIILHSSQGVPADQMGLTSQRPSERT